MLRQSWMICMFVAAVVLASSDAASASDAEDIARYRHAKAIESLMETSGDDALAQFAKAHLAPAYRDSFAPGKLMEYLQAIRAACANPGGVLVEHLGDGGVRVKFMQDGRETAVVFHMQPVVPYLITALALEGSSGRAAGPEVAPFTWDTLEARLDEEAEAGFSGSVLVVRGGNVVLSRGYGLANRERKIPNDTRTIFAIGSTPIDFTRGAILKLEEMGKLKTSDPIRKYVDSVPSDKRSITIDHLMSATSGLPNFHGVRGVDADMDLSWIDRETAIRRILHADLLFAPGKGRAHSHSAWVLLAAIVEIASKQPYGDFLRKQFFDPAGMTRTGLHEDLAAYPDDEIANGYDAQSFGRINSPKYWGRTSWLVMGSGGMSSTPGDLHEWVRAIRSGKTLSRASAKKYGPGGGLLVGGDDRGFLCMYIEHRDDAMFLCSNAHTGPGDRASAIGKRLADMVGGFSGPAAQPTD